jgi:tetratricopeptide (TPR) repeat protein
MLCRAWAYRDMGRLDDALRNMDEVLRRWPDDANFCFRAEVHGKRGDWTAAVADHQRQCELEPDDPTTWGWLGWVRATCPDETMRNGPEALALATKACELSGWCGDGLKTLAVAHAECGNFIEAISWANKALPLLTEEKDKQTVRAMLEEFRAGRAYRTEESP